MLEIRFIRKNTEVVKKAAKDKNINLNLDHLLDVDKKKIELHQEIEKLQSLRNDLNEKMKTVVNNDERKSIIKKGKEIKAKLEIEEPKYKEIEKEFKVLMTQVPNVISEDTPRGSSDVDNKTIYQDKIPTFNFIPKDHIQIGKDLDILDLEKGAKVAGYRGYYVKNEGVSLMMAMMMYALNKMIEKGYVPMIPPTLVKSNALFGTGYFKGLEYDDKVDEVYKVLTGDKEEKFLVGTAEPSLLAYYSNETLKEKQLPIKVCGYSQCYRSEIGSYGKDVKGLYRVHEFMKIEQVVLMEANRIKSIEMHDNMLEISKEIHRELELPYRVVQICTGDMNAGKYRAFDIEAWMPGLNRWGETGSASNFLDWQARRLNTKYIDAQDEKKYVYMLNNTVLPSPRPFIAILENYQQADGSVKIPEVLHKYMPKGMKKISPKK
ncbi:serine--tRNA ligase [Patescibacteria group bacterium]|nr:serine--tRNA ligase [Patescibacteria group bacterium]